MPWARVAASQTHELVGHGRARVVDLEPLSQVVVDPAGVRAQLGEDELAVNRRRSPRRRRPPVPETPPMPPCHRPPCRLPPLPAAPPAASAATAAPATGRHVPPTPALPPLPPSARRRRARPCPANRAASHRGRAARRSTLPPLPPGRRRRCHLATAARCRPPAFTGDTAAARAATGAAATAALPRRHRDRLPRRVRNLASRQPAAANTATAQVASGALARHPLRT
jgi:hypothetical protein